MYACACGRDNLHEVRRCMYNGPDHLRWVAVDTGDKNTAATEHLAHTPPAQASASIAFLDPSCIVLRVQDRSCALAAMVSTPRSSMSRRCSWTDGPFARFFFLCASPSCLTFQLLRHAPLSPANLGTGPTVVEPGLVVAAQPRDVLCLCFAPPPPFYAGV